jgi:hypothetical protein
LIRLLPDGLTVLFCPAAALPALMPVPADPPVAVPVVVPLAGDPVVMLPAAEVPAELPPAVPPLDCASAQVPVNASAVANPNVVSFIIAPFPWCGANDLPAAAFLAPDHSSLLFPAGLPRPQPEIARMSADTTAAVGRYLASRYN